MNQVNVLEMVNKYNDDESELIRKMYRLYILNDLFENGEEWVREGFIGENILNIFIMREIN